MRYCITCGRQIPETSVTYGLQLCASCISAAYVKATPAPNPLSGWECPRCHTVRSPFVQKCECGPAVEYVTRDGTGACVPENHHATS